MYRDSLIFDVGMHRGEDSAYYLRKGYDVVAFEAEPSNLALCEARFRREVADGRLHIISGAITPDENAEEVPYYVNLHTTSWATTDRNWVARNKRLGTTSVEIMVPRADIVKAFERFGVPYYLKIDIEGADRYVLSTLKDMSDRPRYISIESEKVDFGALETDIELLQSLGFSKFKIVQQELIPGRRIRVSDIFGHPFEYTFEPEASGPFGDDLPGEWLTAREALQNYRRLFVAYKFLGDNSPFGGKFSRAVGFAGKIIRRPMPGWHDLHGSLG